MNEQVIVQIFRHTYIVSYATRRRLPFIALFDAETTLKLGYFPCLINSVKNLQMNSSDYCTRLPSLGL